MLGCGETGRPAEGCGGRHDGSKLVFISIIHPISLHRTTQSLASALTHLDHVDIRVLCMGFVRVDGNEANMTRVKEHAPFSSLSNLLRQRWRCILLGDIGRGTMSYTLACSSVQVDINQAKLPQRHSSMSPPRPGDQRDAELEVVSEFTPLHTVEQSCSSCHDCIVRTPCRLHLHTVNHTILIDSS